MSVQCPYCRTQLSEPDGREATPVICPRCNGTFLASRADLKTGIRSETQSKKIGRPASRKAKREDNAIRSDLAKTDLPAASLSEGDPRTETTHVFSLGEFLSGHIGPGCGCALFGGLGVAAAIAMAVSVFQTGWDRRDDQGGVILCFFVIVLPLCFVGVACVAYVVRRFVIFPREVTVDENGIRWTGLLGDDEINWPDVAEVWRSEVISGDNVFNEWLGNVEVRTVDGKKLAFDRSLSDYGELAGKIQQFGFDQLLPEKRREWRKGNVNFGPVTLWPDRLAVRFGIDRLLEKHDVRWDELKAWGVWNGHLALITAKSPIKFAFGDIPNYMALLALFEEASGQPHAAMEVLVGVFGPIPVIQLRQAS